MFPAGRRFIGRFGQAGKDGFFRVRFILRRFIGRFKQEKISETPFYIR